MNNIPPITAKCMSGNPLVTSREPGLRLCGFVTVGGFFLFSCHLAVWGRETRAGPFGHPRCASRCVSAGHPCCFTLTVGSLSRGSVTFSKAGGTRAGCILSGRYCVVMVRGTKPSSSSYICLILSCLRLYHQPWS